MDEPGHPEELKQVLRNWLAQAQSPIGSLPAGTDPVDWAIRQFIIYWEKPVRAGLENLEESLNRARKLCTSQSPHSEISAEIDYAFQIIEEDLRCELGMSIWNKRAE